MKTPLQLIASIIWNISEILGPPLGRFAPTVFGWMIGSKEKKKLENRDLNESVAPPNLSEEEIRKQAREFCDKWFPKWEKHCEVCKEINCKSNDNCIHCGCQF